MKLVTIILDCGTITIDIRRLTTPYYNNLHEYKGVGFHRSFYFHLPLLILIYYFSSSSSILAEEAEARKKGGVAYVRKASKLVLYVEVHR